MITIIGKNVVKEAVRAKRKIYSLYLETQVSLKDKDFLEKTRTLGIKVHILPKHEFDKKFGQVTQGYAADVEAYQYTELESKIDVSKKQVFVLLDGWEDPHNLGAILRSADATNCDAIVIPKNNSVSLNATVAKVSTGAIEYVDVVMVNNLNRAIDDLKKAGFWIIGADMDGDMPMEDIDVSTSIALVLGSEGFGLSRLTKKSCDHLVSIPMSGHVNSLNASVSAALLMYEIYRKKLK